ncbi:MAG: hypothetical protein KF857_05055 [Fimbriimonadaceae bacterium]|nr:hypothetical protein [Fimbriimonadaceae bacterium]
MKRFLSLSFLVVAMGSMALAQQGHRDHGKSHAHNPSAARVDDGDIEATNRGGKKSTGAPCVMSRKGEAAPFAGNSSYRSGTSKYDNGIHRGHFRFHGYALDFDGTCAPSPWYGYAHMPAYVETDHLRVSHDPLFDFGAGSSHRYRPHHFPKFDAGRLDCAADRISEAFRGYDFDRMAWLVDSDSLVQVQVGDADHYDMRGADFKDLMRDLLDETSTSSYRVKSTRSWNGGASVTVEHSFVDPWGQRKTSVHRYGLKMTDLGYRLASFRADSR